MSLRECSGGERCFHPLRPCALLAAAASVDQPVSSRRRSVLRSLRSSLAASAPAVLLPRSAGLISLASPSSGGRSRSLPESLRGTASDRLLSLRLRFAQSACLRFSLRLRCVPPGATIARRLADRSRLHSSPAPAEPTADRTRGNKEFPAPLPQSARDLAGDGLCQIAPLRSNDPTRPAAWPGLAPRPPLNPAPFAAFLLSAACVRTSLRPLRSLSCSLRTG